MENRLHNTLEQHLDFWIETGESDFAVSVIMSGYVRQLAEVPPRYRAKNNNMYLSKIEWVNEAVGKLLRTQLGKEVYQEELVCINLTVAKNAA